MVCLCASGRGLLPLLLLQLLLRPAGELTAGASISGMRQQQALAVGTPPAPGAVPSEPLPPPPTHIGCRGIQLRGMAQDLSWGAAAEQYEAVLLAAKYQW